MNVRRHVGEEHQHGLSFMQSIVREHVGEGKPIWAKRFVWVSVRRHVGEEHQHGLKESRKTRQN